MCTGLTTAARKRQPSAWQMRWPRWGHEMTLAVRYDYGPLRSMAADNVRILDMKLPEKGKLRKNIKNVAILRKIMNGGEYDILMAVLAEMAEVAAAAHALGRQGDASCLRSPQHSFRGKNKLSPAQAQLFTAFLTASMPG